MYRYVMNKALKEHLKFHAGTNYVKWESFVTLRDTHGFPSEYMYSHVLRKLVSFEFYSKKKLHVLYVAGYPLDAKFFDESRI